MTPFDKFCGYLITAHFVVFSTMGFISVSALSLTHIFILIPAIYFTAKYFKEFDFPLSAKFLFLFVILGWIGTVVDYQELHYPFKAFSSYKYFLLGALCIAPYHFWLNKIVDEPKLKKLIIIFLITTTIAHLMGFYGMYTGFNIFKGKYVKESRAMGMFGNIMTYGYQSAWYVILLFGIFSGKMFQNFKLNSNLIKFSLLVGTVGTWLSFARGAIVGIIGAFLYFIFFLFKESKLAAIKAFLLFFFALGALLFLPKFIGPQVSISQHCFGADVCEYDNGIELFLYGNLYKEQRLFSMAPKDKVKVNTKNGNRLIQKLDSSSNMIRVSQYRAAWGLFKENVWWGIGLKEFAEKAVTYKEQNHIPFSYFKSHAHNNYLEIFVSSGIFAGICFLLWIFFWFWEMWKAQSNWSIIVGMVIISFVISGLVQCTITDGENAFFLFAVYGLSCAATLKRKAYANAVR